MFIKCKNYSRMCARRITQLFAQPKQKQIISIAILLMLYTVGVVSAQTDFRDLTLSISGLFLLICTALVLWNDREISKIEWIIWIWGFIVGFGIEVLGVHTGLIFGEYTYGENLGIKVFEVPLIIGVQWVLLSYSAKEIGKVFKMPFFVMLPLAIIVMVGLDIKMEQMAPILDFWEFNGGVAPIQNFTAWAAVSLAVLYPYKSRYNKFEAPNLVALVNLVLYMVFFLLV